jgi:DNA-binding XRE family transcriptional regulator
MAQQLRMTADIRTWLAGLRSSDPAAARAIGAVTMALLTAGGKLGQPLVRELGPAAALDDTHLALDRAYQRGLEITQDPRRAAADAATARKRIEDQVEAAQALVTRFQDHRRRAVAAGHERLARQLAGDEATARDHLAGLTLLLDRAAATEGRLIAFAQRLQRSVDAFRTRKEVLKATYTAASIERLIDNAMTALQTEAGPSPNATGSGPAGPGEAGPGEVERITARSMIVRRPQEIRSAIQAFNQEIRNEYQQAGLHCPVLVEVPRTPDILELRPSEPDCTIRILFAFEPPDVPLLLAVLQPPDQAENVIRLASERLQRARADGAPTPLAMPTGQAELVSYDARSFLSEFFPDEGQDIAARAADLAARASSRTLAQTRIWMGLSQAQVAERMNVRQERISAIERGDLAATEVRTLAAYVRALGGRLEVAADFAGERIVLR